MRLEAGAVRELHWHSSAEWAYVLKGTMQITTVTPDGQNYVGTAVRPPFYYTRSLLTNCTQHTGDLWYLPPGHPHSLQATADDPAGSEFLLVSHCGYDDS